MSTLTRSFARLVVLYGGALLVTFWVLAPFVWMAFTSIEPERNITSRPLALTLAGVSLEKYETLLADESFSHALRNSLVVSLGTTVLCVLLAAVAAYPLARLRLRFGWPVLLGLIASRMVPAIVLIVPLFLVVRQLGLIDTHLALVLVYTAFLLPFAIWMLRTFFLEIPQAVEAAARLDGCTRIGALFRIVLPLSLPGVAATATFVFVSSWNEYMFPLVLTTADAKVLTVRIAELTSGNQGFFDFGQLMAGGVITVLPALVLVLFMNRQIVKGLIEGATKA
jgi:ABC-type sugar transport system, permease component